MRNTDLPEGWKWVKLGDVTKKKSLKVLPSTDPNAKFIGMDCIEPNSLVPHVLHDFKDFKSAGNSFKKGQVLYGRMRPYLNKVYKAEFDGVASGEFIILETTNSFNPDLLKYILHSRSFVEFANSITSGDRPRISYEEITDFDILQTPPSVQQAIVSKIEELFSEIDKGIETLRTAQQQLKVYRQAVLKWAFEGRLTNEDVKEGEFPDGWKATEIKHVCSNIKVGIVVKPTNFYSKHNDGIKAFRSANVREFQINDTDWVYFTEESNQINHRTIVKEADVLLVRSGYPGTSCVVTKKFDGCNAIDILIATPDISKVLPEYLCAFNNSPLGKGLFKAQSRGVAQKHLNVGEYSKLKICIPSLQEQRRVIERIESRLSVADKIEETITQSLQQSEALKQSILKRAFEGALSINTSPVP